MPDLDLLVQDTERVLTGKFLIQYLLASEGLDQRPKMRLVAPPFFLACRIDGLADLPTARRALDLFCGTARHIDDLFRQTKKSE